MMKHLPQVPEEKRQPEHNRQAMTLGVRILSQVFAVLTVSTVPLLLAIKLDDWLDTRFIVYLGGITSAVFFFIGLFSIASHAQKHIN